MVATSYRGGRCSAALIAAAIGLGMALPHPLPAQPTEAAPIRPLIASLRDETPQVRCAAAEALAVFGPQARDALPDLLATLKDRDEGVRHAAAVALAAIGKEAIPPLLRTLKGHAPKIRLYADQDSQIRPFADQFSFNLGEIPPQDWDAIVSCRAAVEALTALGRDAVPALGAALTDRDVTVRWGAARALAEIGPQAREALPALSIALKDPDPAVYLAATAALAEFGKDAVPPLITALKGQDRWAGAAASDALQQIGKDAVPHLRPLMRDPDPAVRNSAIRALEGIGPEAQDALPDLRAALKDEDDWVRQAAAGALVSPARKPALNSSTLIS